MKKIAYIELDTHAEIASLLIEVLAGTDAVDIDFYLSPKVFRLVGRHQPNIHISEPEALLEQLGKKKYDLVIIGTVHRYFNLFECICEKFPTAVFVHNLNFSKASSLRLVKSVFQKDCLYRIKLLLKEDLLSAPDVYRKAKWRLVLDQELAKDGYICFPLFFSEPFSVEIEQKKPLHIVVPGSVSQQRRDYQHILKRLKMFTVPVKIVFLGKASGKELEWLHTAEKELPENVTIEYFTEKVGKPVFTAKMKEASVLWCPLQKETSFMGIPEIYGETKMSGNIGDSIRYSKIGVFPESYRTSFPFIVTEDKGATEMQFLRLASSGYDFQKNFSKDEVRRQVENLLKTLLN